VLAWRRSAAGGNLVISGEITDSAGSPGNLNIATPTVAQSASWVVLQNSNTFHGNINITSGSLVVQNGVFADDALGRGSAIVINNDDPGSAFSVRLTPATVPSVFPSAAISCLDQPTPGSGGTITSGNNNGAITTYTGIIADSAPGHHNILQVEAVAIGPRVLLTNTNNSWSGGLVIGTETLAKMMGS